MQTKNLDFQRKRENIELRESRQNKRDSNRNSNFKVKLLSNHKV